VTADRLIKWSAVAVVVAVAAIAAVVSYTHALAIVEAHGESGAVARMVPLTVDGLIYASSMALLPPGRGAKHRPWPTGCWPWASVPPWPRTWHTASLTARLALRSPRGRRCPWSARMSC
jgi:Protein of unknown function (DUF2637)